MTKVRVLIVDDSALVRKVLTEILSSDNQIEVVGTAPDPYIARAKIKQLNPDVITLDVEMPKMDGLGFLSNIMRLRPMPVVMVSSLTQKGAEVTMRALAMGAVDFVEKPAMDVETGLERYAAELIKKVKNAAKSNVKAVDWSERIKRMGVQKEHPIKQKASDFFKTTNKIIASGASTGGTEAIKDVLIQMPPDTPGVVIAQHIPGAFSQSFAQSVNNIIQMQACQAVEGQQILRGHVYIAPGDYHLIVVRDGGRYLCKIDNSEPVNRHKPSVDVLFNSVAKEVGPNSMGVMLTGMGHDGAKGMKAMRDAGAVNIAQDEESSVVWGMPGSAVNEGGVDHILPLSKIAAKVLEIIKS